MAKNSAMSVLTGTNVKRTADAVITFSQHTIQQKKKADVVFAQRKESQ